VVNIRLLLNTGPKDEVTNPKQSCRRFPEEADTFEPHHHAVWHQTPYWVDNGAG